MWAYAEYAFFEGFQGVFYGCGTRRGDGVSGMLFVEEVECIAECVWLVVFCGDARVLLTTDVEVVWPVEVEAGVCFGIRRGCKVQT